jgi:hypothetical protein
VSRVDASDAAVSPMLLVNYGRTLRQLGRIDESARYAEEGYARAKSTGSEVVVNQSLLLRAAIYREQGNLARATTMLREVSRGCTRRFLRPSGFRRSADRACTGCAGKR